jgi:hypothetical protein
VRCDSTGENKGLEFHCKLIGINASLKYSGPRTPERKGKVERNYQTLYGRIRAMLKEIRFVHLKLGVFQGNYQ